MNSTSRRRIPLYALMFAFTYSSRTHTMDQAQDAALINEDIAQIKNTLSILTQSSDSSLSGATVTSIQHWSEKQGRGGTRLYRIDAINRKGEQDSYVTRLQTSCWTKTKDAKQSEIDAMKVGGQEHVGVCPRVIYADPQFGDGKGIIIMKHRNYGTAQNVDWEDEQTYIKLARLLRTMHKQPMEKQYVEKERTWHYCVAKGYIPKIVKTLEELQCNTDFLTKSASSLQDLEMLNKIHEILPHIPPCYHLCHGDLHSGNLIPVLDEKGNVIGFEAVDWDHRHFTGHPYTDIGLLRSAYVPEKMKHIFNEIYWQGEEPKPQEYEYALLKVLSTLAAIFNGAAYANLQATYLAQNFEKLRHQKKVNSIARALMHKGINLITKAECGTLGAALLCYGLQQTDKPEWPKYIETLGAFKKSEAN